MHEIILCSTHFDQNNNWHILSFPTLILLFVAVTSKTLLSRREINYENRVYVTCDARIAGVPKQNNGLRKLEIAFWDQGNRFLFQRLDNFSNNPNFTVSCLVNVLAVTSETSRFKIQLRSSFFSFLQHIL